MGYSYVLMCTRPIQMRRPNIKTPYKVPCGKCKQCKQTRVHHWAYRINKEGERSSSPFFITLTYNEQNVPIVDNYNGKSVGTLHKRDIQLFLKRLRKSYAKESDKKIVYYAVGEYGSRTQRPHYHIIMFNCDNPDLIHQSWKNGFTYTLPLLDGGVPYVLKYISKESQIKHPDDIRQKEFSLMSKGIGSNHLTDSMRAYHKRSPDHCKITLKGTGIQMSLPRYYKLKVYTDDEIKEITKHHKKRFSNSDAAAFSKQRKKFPQHTDDKIWQDLEYRKLFPNIAIDNPSNEVL